jgi:hypothetical protein
MFVWLTRYYGALVACLVVGGLYVSLAAAAMATSRRSRWPIRAASLFAETSRRGERATGAARDFATLSHAAGAGFICAARRR